MTASTRRAALGAILASPLASVPAVAAASSSDLARACVWAIGHAEYINDAARREPWTDEQLDKQIDRYNAIFSRALVQPSASLEELAAKARLCLYDFEEHLHPFKDGRDDDAPDDGERLVVVVLREVIKLCA